MTAHVLSPDDLRAPPARENYIVLPASFGTRFMLVVDTEEEFDWAAPFDRESRSVTICGPMRRGQAYFRKAGVRPLYVTDYPVINDAEAGPMLSQWQAAGEADIGAHCHPWVNPPHEEEVSVANSFAGNLPEALERAKIMHLRDRIKEVTGRAPIAFRAGRYGAGPNTARILANLGFRLDTSVRSRFDYSAQAGPDFSGLPVTPWRAGPGGVLIELPLSTAFAGPLGRWGDTFQPLIERGGLAAGGLSRSQLLQRIPLTPEGINAEEAIRGIDALLAENVRLFLFSFHSPTLAPGNTPYVRTAPDLARFYAWWDTVLDHLARRGVKAAGLEDVLAACAPR
ncbi:MAG: polysaccharide deacetylase family protein [Sphingobium sp.]|nr:polysaccharide deacetylase family protein [Sphingobium sp.]MBP6111829.1 polysaccharide deacetylase family protein [Sphingobium sp.]MBP8669928.1 polysaccharide deacetylase family protein [Sphingobium sp.]MBP9157859.1 polysaccharide deacetylase family protein [Sphingobium sp.]MCC6482926.1 polysaccharide deacetylase family protein [Sphingomonadaceae bacterium]